MAGIEAGVDGEGFTVRFSRRCAVRKLLRAGWALVIGDRNGFHPPPLMDAIDNKPEFSRHLASEILR
jgi:hypothetical protein